MSEIPKAYEPQSVEEKWYRFWLEQKCFVADPTRVSEKRPAYSIVIPPPNVTGMLHMGHVLNNTIQDILSRKARMDGKEVLWLPGTDHAGIATEGMVSKQIWKEEKKSKRDIGREEFIKRVWTWKEKHGGIIIEQLKKLGCSCDWTRERFTMDADYVRHVQRVFVDLYKKGLIYRGKRMVNWCPVSQTALSDEEVEMKPQKGFMYHFKVQVADATGSSGHESADIPSEKSQSQLTLAATKDKRRGAEVDDQGRIWLTIATTRPETIPGDTAVAVNPKDTRYAHLIGKHIIRPLPIQIPHEQKLIPIIGDEQVDFEFGTGVLKVTPAHDKADFEIGARHKLPLIDIMNPNGTMNDLAGESLAGLDRFEARNEAVDRLRELGALVEEKPYENNVGYSQRADVPIEPRLSEQWFLKYPVVKESKECVEQNEEAAIQGADSDKPYGMEVTIPVWHNSRWHEAAEKIIPIIKQDWHAISGQSASEIRAKAWRFAEEHGFLNSDFPNLDAGFDITVQQSSLEHAFSNKGLANIKLVPSLPALLRHAVRVATVPHDPPAREIVCVHVFYAAIHLGHTLFSVKFTVKEFHNRLRLYDHQTVQVKKIETDGKYSPEEASVSGSFAPWPASVSAIKLADLVAVVNPSLLVRCQIGSPGPGWTQELHSSRATTKMRFHPQRWAKVYDHWLTNIQDWCISRQLWWGHRIPVWYAKTAADNLKKDLEIPDFSDSEITGKNIKELRASAWHWAETHHLLNRSFLNRDTGWEIEVRASSLEHAFSNFGVANVKLLPHLPMLIEGAIHLVSLPHDPPAPPWKCVHLFFAGYRYQGRLHRVKIVVKEREDGRLLYDHQAVEVQKNETDGIKSPGTHLREEKLVTRPTPVSSIKLSDVLADVNSEQFLTRCQIESPGADWEQDPDVLDTWFSSWLWPFATMGWPEKTPTLKAFYPTTDLVTGPDIIFFWVARMIMAGYEFMGDLPFKNVYFTGIIRDKQGRKMSKTLGNSPDPLELIAKYGADALRFGTMRSAPIGQDVLFDEKDVELGRNFGNKLWNACRFRQMQNQSAADILSAENSADENQNSRQNIASTWETEGEIRPELLTGDDQWILLKLDQAIREVSGALAEYKFSEATTALYRFFWSEYCDWYIEASKAVLSHNVESLKRENVKSEAGSTIQPVNDSTTQKINTLAVMDFILSNTLRLFHPFIPFITEELWHGMNFNRDLPKGQGGDSIMFAPWPKPFDDDFKSHYRLNESDARLVDAKYELVTHGRNLQREGNIPSSKRVKFIFKPSRDFKSHDAEVLKILLNAESLEVNPTFTATKGTPSALSPLGELFLPLEGLIDVEAEKVRLKKELEKNNAEIVKVEQKLNNPAFTQKVPPAVLEEHQKRLTDWQAKKQHVETALAALG